MPYVEGERFVDAAAYTETNAAFHDYLFTLTGNEHLLHAYQALGVKGQMEESLRNATWCHPRCAQDHLDIVDAFEAGDRDAARALITDHAERSKQTMRRAMAGPARRTAPRASSPRAASPARSSLVTGAAQGIGEATARRISAEGGTLVLADRAETVKELADELAGTGGAGRPSPVVADLETWDGAESVVATAISRVRPDRRRRSTPWAARSGPSRSSTTRPSEIQAEINRSLLADALVLPRRRCRTWSSAGKGTIVNVSSVATRGIHRCPYCRGEGRGQRDHRGAGAGAGAVTGIRVVGHRPGRHGRPAAARSRERPDRRTTRSGSGTRRDRRPDDRVVADEALRHARRAGRGDLTFLASEEASYITGTVLPVAGGDLG